MECKVCSIGKVCTNVTSGGTPKSSVKEYYDGNIPWLNTKEINFNRIYSTERTISQSGLDNSSAKWVPAKTVIVAMYGATAGRVAITQIPLTTNQACCNLSVDPDVADYEYTYYYLKNQYDQLAGLANGGAQQNLNVGIIKDFPIVLPSMKAQRQIAAVLGALDDKIETNERINTNLIEMIRSIYREFFSLPETTKDGTISDVALSVTDGVHNTVHDDPDGNFRLLSCKNIIGGSLQISPKDRRINKETFDRLRRRTNLAKGDILISSVGTVGELVLLNSEPDDYEFQRSVAMVKPNPSILSPGYLYAALDAQKNELKNAAHGAVQQCLFISDIKAFPLGVPESSALARFDRFTTPLFNAITLNEQETHCLETLRDALLPRLISGEIDVSSVILNDTIGANAEFLTETT